RVLATGSYLKNVTVEGDLASGDLTLLGEVGIHGTVHMTGFDQTLVFGDFQNPGMPVQVDSGTFDMSDTFRKTLAGDFSTAQITLGADVLLHGGNVFGVFIQPLLNKGTVNADVALAGSLRQPILITDSIVT